MQWMPPASKFLKNKSTVKIYVVHSKSDPLGRGVVMIFLAVKIRFVQ